MIDINGIRKRRIRLGATQQQLAELSGLSQGFISQLELGRKRDIGLSSAKSLVRAFAKLESKKRSGRPKAAR